MPAETHQLGRRLDSRVVAEFLRNLLDDSSPSGESGAVTLAAGGLLDEDMEWLWEAACDEFAERAVAPEAEPGFLIPDMTIREAANRIAALLPKRYDDAR